MDKGSKLYNHESRRLRSADKGRRMMVIGEARKSFIFISISQLI